MSGITSIKGLTDPEQNREYQSLILDAAWGAILKATVDPATNQAMLRNEDIILALADLQALVASSSPTISSPSKAREWADSVSRRLRVRVMEFKKAEASSSKKLFDNVIDATRKQ